MGPAPIARTPLAAASRFTTRSAGCAQEENQYLAVPFEEARTFSRQLQCLMGYELGTVNLGFVDHKHPNDILNGTAGDQAGVLGPQELMDADNAIRRFKIEGTKAVGRARMRV